MGKEIKNKQYFKRFQVKFRRRRSGHTDYAQRHKLITQDKNKYQSPKYRLVVRFSNRYVLCQIVAAEITGDKVICSATSQELPRYGLKQGLKNYCAAYCTGLLCARRLLKSIGLEDTYPGVEEVDGTCRSWTAEGEEIEGRNNAKSYFVEVEEEAEKKPFRCYLDVGIKTATRGAKVFSAMKGASDGGLDIPHNHKRFPGYDPDTDAFDPEELKERIMGSHIAAFMEEMEEDDEENYAKVFKAYHDNEVEPDDINELYESVHAKIRENPEAKKGLTFDEDGNQSAFTYKKTGKEWKKPSKKSYEDRKADSNAKKAALQEA